MFSRQDRMIGVLYALAEAFLALASFLAAHTLRAHWHGLRPLYPAIYYLWIVPLIPAIWVGTAWALGSYRDPLYQDFRRVLAVTLKVGVTATILIFALIQILKVQHVSRLLLLLFGALQSLAVLLFRWMAHRAGNRLGMALTGTRHYLLVGDTAEAVKIAQTIEANAQRGMLLSGFAVLKRHQEKHLALQPGALSREYPVYELDDLPQLLRTHVIDEVIFAVSREELDQLHQAFMLCEEEGVRTRLLLSFFPHRVSRVSLEELRGMPLLTFSTTPENEYLMLLKRAIDFAMAAILLVLLSPLMILLALAIKLTSEGPVYYRQTRCGLGGRKFTVLKFRSMISGAEMKRGELEALNEMDGPVFKIRNDPRCTPVGRLMRKFSLDELPQLFNILRGDMAFVGPRPPLPREVDQYELWQRRRLRMPPGLTCLWALEGRNNLNFRRWMELDLEYIDRWSPALDWKILLKTIPIVLLGRGAS